MSKRVNIVKIVNNRIVNHLEKYGLFSHFQSGFRSSQTTADLLTVVSDRIVVFLQYINDLPNDVICNIAIYAGHTSLYSKCYQASGLWQQLDLVSELESDL